MWIYIINQFLFYEIITRIGYRFSDLSQRKKAFGIMVIVLLSLHFVCFQYLKQQNYYELLNLSRVHDASDLKQAFKKQAVLHHPDKKKDDPNADLYFNQLIETNKFLQDQKQNRLYDLYGQEMTQILNQGDVENQLFKINLTRLGIIFFIRLIFGAVLSFNESTVNAKKIVVFSQIVLIILQIGQYFQDKSQLNYLDYVFPQYTTFDRIQLLDFLNGPIITVLRASQQLFSKDVYMELYLIAVEIQKNINLIIKIIKKEKQNTIKQQIEQGLEPEENPQPVFSDSNKLIVQDEINQLLQNLKKFIPQIDTETKDRQITKQRTKLLSNIFYTILIFTILMPYILQMFNIDF